MTTGMSNRTVFRDRYYAEKDLFLKERFYPGELGGVILLEIAALLLWSLAIYGILLP